MKSNYQNDYFTKKAQQKKLRARSYFKLEEIDNKYKFIKNANFILDLGAAPGSWSQYCLAKSKAKIFAIDLQKIEPLKNLFFHQLDIFDLTKEIVFKFFDQFPKQKEIGFSVLLSDMAPKTTGNKFSDSMDSQNLVEQVLKISNNLLLPDGWLVAKYFEGEDKETLYQICKKKFSFFKVFIPKSTRTNSREVFLVMNTIKQTKKA